MKLKGISPVIAVLLLIVIVVAAALLYYAWATGYESAIFGLVSQEKRELIKIEGLKVVESDDRTYFLIYVRNIGDITVRVSAVYLVRGASATLLTLGYSTQSPPIWGGDVYQFNNDTGAIVQVKSGLIFYEDFRDGYDSSQWVEVSTLKFGQGKISVDPIYGLVITISRSSTPGIIEKYGLRLRSPLSFSDGDFVAEYETVKLSGTDKNYMVEVYLSCYGTTDDDPYNLYGYILTRITGVGGPYVSYPFARSKYGENADSKKWRSKSSSTWWEVIYSLKGGISIEIKNNYGSWSPSDYKPPLNQIYVYLDAGIWRRESGTYSVAFPYVKIYDSLYVNVSGVEPGWEVVIMGEGGSVIASKTSTGDYVLFSRDELGGYPIEGHIVILGAGTGGTAAGGGVVIEPGEVKMIVAVFDGSLTPGNYLIKVATERGTEAIYALRKR